MNISTILQQECEPRRNLFIQYANSFMSAPVTKNPIEEAIGSNSIEQENKSAKLGIENLQEFTIFPREVVDGKTIITA